MKRINFIPKIMLLGSMSMILGSNLVCPMDFDPALVQSVRLVHEAQDLEVQGNYDAALKKYNAALDPKLNKYRWEEASARGGIVNLYIKMSQYDKALQAMDWFLEDNREPTAALEQIKGIKALKQYQDSGNPEPVSEHIMLLKEEYKKILPPQNWIVASDTYIFTILRLYDKIGDYDSAMAYIDMCMEYFKKQDIQKYGKYKPGKADQQYLTIQEGFKKDKAAHTKGNATKGLLI
ncbi:MAG: hypothetical protein EXS63_05470 [Candidatus Omnitrophica bacterium]|nr:hypothetical protein [Candidatus Omnitrophota bacterium]